MKDNQKKYLDKVVSLLVRDTRIDYDNKTLTFPFRPPSEPPSSYSSFFSPSSLPSFLFSTFIYFSEYSRDTYGIVGDELQYVWKEYKDIIIDKIRNER